MSANPETSSRPAEEAPLALATVAAALALLGVAWGVLHTGPWQSVEIVDTPVYQRYGDAIAEGAVPYRDVRPEYPPAALPTFVVPSLVAGTGAELSAYDRVFGWLMLACAAASVVLAAVTLGAVAAGPVRLAGALALVAVGPLLLGTVVLTRFDFWPAALTAGALAAFAWRRARLGAGILALAVAAKIYAGALVPLLAVWLVRRCGVRPAVAAGAVFAAVLVAVVGPFLVVGPDGVAAFLARHARRPVEIEALGAVVLIALHHLVGLDVEMVGSHGSQNIGGTLGSAVGTVHTLAQVAAVAAVAAGFARGPATPERLLRYAAATLVAFVALGKVLSPQFLIWLIPVVPLVAGRRGLLASGLLAVSLVLTQGWFPFRYWEYAREFDGLVTTLVLARDLVLVALLAVLVWPERERGRELDGARAGPR